MILYDDIRTTGSTLDAMCLLLGRRNVVRIVGVNNRGVIDKKENDGDGETESA